MNDTLLKYDENAYVEAVTSSNDYEVYLWPVFGPHQYLINYSANGGVNAPQSQVKTFGIKLDRLASDTDTNADGSEDLYTNQMTRVGYNFIG